MIQPEAQTASYGTPLTGAAGLEARLRQLFAEQQRLRELLDQTQAERDAVTTELFRLQDEYCTDAARQEEYDSAIERILGIDPRIDLKEVEEVLAGRRSCDMREFLEELERSVQATPSQGAE